jgi:hypothetical protein
MVCEERFSPNHYSGKKKAMQAETKTPDRERNETVEAGCWALPPYRKS